MMELQPLGAEAIEAILAVYRQCEDFLALGPQPLADRSMVAADLAHSQAAGGSFYGIVEDGELVGVLDLTPSGWEGQPEVAFLSLLMIAAPYRGRGLGAQVVSWAEAQAKAQGAQIVRAGVQVNNPRAARFWERMGYQKIAGPISMEDGTTVWELSKTIAH